jgi:hypothetical protein
MYVSKSHPSLIIIVSSFISSSDLHAQRLGHGYNVFSTELVLAKPDPQRFVDGLVRYCAVNRILFEVS